MPHLALPVICDQFGGGNSNNGNSGSINGATPTTPFLSENDDESYRNLNEERQQQREQHFIDNNMTINNDELPPGMEYQDLHHRMGVPAPSVRGESDRSGIAAAAGEGDFVRDKLKNDEQDLLDLPSSDIPMTQANPIYDDGNDAPAIPVYDYNSSSNPPPYAPGSAVPPWEIPSQEQNPETPEDSVVNKPFFKRTWFMSSLFSW